MRRLARAKGRAQVLAQPTRATLDGAGQYLRGRPTFSEHPFLAERQQQLSDASVNSYVRGLRAFASTFPDSWQMSGILGEMPKSRISSVGSRTSERRFATCNCNTRACYELDIK